ncbi:MAG: alkaline phosphatase family protein [Bacteroidota bacterium]
MKRLLTLLVLIAILFLTISCNSEKEKRVILIGIDGLSTDGIQIANTPNLNRLIRDGAFTLKARGVMPTVSSPNWGSMLCGAGPEQHGITKNGWTTSNYTVEPTTADEEGYFPSIFTLIKDQMPGARTAMFYDWEGLGDLINKKYIDKVEYLSDYNEVYKQAIPYFIEEIPEFTFIYVGHVDHIGHTSQHGSPEYYMSIEEVDERIGELLDALDKAGLYEETHIMVISDHGGVGYGHGGESMAEIQIPWLIKGPGIVKNRLIDEPVNTFNTASTIAYIFGLKQHNHWIAKPVLSAFFDNSGTNEEIYLPKPKTSQKSGIYLESKQLILTVNEENAEIRFTSDGTNPDLTSTLYAEPIYLDKTQTIKAVAIQGDIRSNVSTVEFTKVMGIKNVTLLNMPNPKYPAEHAGLSLFDRNKTNDDFLHPTWMGFEEEDFEAVLDFGDIKTFNKVSVRCLENENSWIFLPTQVDFYVSNDGENFNPAGIIDQAGLIVPDKGKVVNIGKELGPTESRYLKIIVKNIKQCPPGHKGAGGKAWLFIDEVLIE